VGKGAQRRAHVGVNEDCESAVGTLRFAHPTLALPTLLSLKEYPREGVLRRAGFCLGNRNGDESQEECRIIGDARRRAD
jgi:hypothetical protein